MCGITGIYGFNMVGCLSMINLAASVKALESRGPDFQNTYNDTRVGLGHRRLSIIDTSTAGHQPMSAENGRYQLIFNGEIYNFLELKKGLEVNYNFRSHSDTEVLLYHLIEKGRAGIADLNGFFSFAFYDRQEAYLLLAIDHAGIKPLYYKLDQDKLIFASELKSLIHYGIEKEIDHTALLTYFQLNYIPAPKTIYKNISKLCPGEAIEIVNGRTEVLSWLGESKSGENFEGDYESAQKRLKDLMSKSVERRLMADVPLGSFLSGGLDSSIIAALAKEQKEDLHTFSIGFDHKYFDETSYSASVAKHIGSEHTEYILKKGHFIEHLEDILDYIDEPFADSSAIAYYLLSKKTRQHSTVALSGDGADELFGGYRKHQALLKSVSGGALNGLLKTFSPLTGLLPGSRSSGLFDKSRQIKRYATGLKMSPADRYWAWAGFKNEKEVRKMLLADYKTTMTTDGYEEYKEMFIGHLRGEKTGLNEFLIADQNLVLPGDMLVKADRMSMANSLEVRVPFLDKNIISFANSLPQDFKIQGNQTKRILYDSFRDRLPEELYHRPKKGFEVPLQDWLKVAVKREKVSDLFEESYVEDQGIFDFRQVRRMKNRLYSINPGDAHAEAWAYVVFQWWWRKWMR